MDETVLRQTPTRLILKMGDDLRQDMITLRMFSLFEKVRVQLRSNICPVVVGRVKLHRKKQRLFPVFTPLPVQVVVKGKGLSKLPPPSYLLVRHAHTSCPPQPH